MSLIISVEEAREILGSNADSMSDDEIINVIQTLDVLAVEALIKSREQMKADALALAELAYDIYRDKKANEQST
ncbi:MAG TPA: hypothetical protein VN778_03910 [Verrucomicrobiae bacterium]|nr:hypothetical protein [Verrucomicrobiae bacterium]